MVLCSYNKFTWSHICVFFLLSVSCTFMWSHYMYGIHSVALLVFRNTITSLKQLHRNFIYQTRSLNSKLSKMKLNYLLKIPKVLSPLSNNYLHCMDWYEPRWLEMSYYRLTDWLTYWHLHYKGWVWHTKKLTWPVTPYFFVLRLEWAPILFKSASFEWPNICKEETA